MTHGQQQVIKAAQVSKDKEKTASSCSGQAKLTGVNGLEESQESVVPWGSGLRCRRSHDLRIGGHVLETHNPLVNIVVLLCVLSHGKGW